jgi:FAD/FMN-containing dehydrogenase
MQNKKNLIWPREGLTERPVKRSGTVRAHLITGWSLHCAVQAPVQRLSMDSCSSVQLAAGSGIPRGGGQSFGDTSLPNRGVPLVLDPVSENTHSSIDEKTGVLICPASMTQQQVLQRIVPTGWVLPVIPGASSITIGGAVSGRAWQEPLYPRLYRRPPNKSKNAARLW